jgi:hypothetical protein
MSKLTLVIATMFLAGCASTGEWQSLNIDGGSETAFGESIARLNDELSYSRGQMFALALVDIANTKARTAGGSIDGRPAYSEEQFRRDLDGLTFDGVIALADQSGPSIKKLYHSRSWGATKAEVDRLMTAGDNPLGPTPPPVIFMDTSNGFSWPNQ